MKNPASHEEWASDLLMGLGVTGSRGFRWDFDEVFRDFLCEDNHMERFRKIITCENYKENAPWIMEDLKNLQDALWEYTVDLAKNVYDSPEPIDDPQADRDCEIYHSKREA